ncbi:FAD binding domain protein [Penicillium malachiteum]|uniref:FAD binding domain protein n=1 Tax=Penicillium malachiteum TaxID=1324776 RepID=UPI002547FE0E|nr:FAD binding domain protein [Penicillium malachiteum]KAJ5735308.1 FAD binding domain protein [Penicillium malachiteum]
MDILWLRLHTSPSSSYEDARLARLFNANRPNYHPTAIVRARTQSDIIKAVQLAKILNLQINVRSGGHSYPGWSLSDNSILIDLVNYRELQVDVSQKEAWVSSGMRSDVDLELMKDCGLMLGAGHHPGVGIGGFLLQGGLSWNSRNWGWACERVKALQVVTADGDLVNCSQVENSDLFWAARGAGPCNESFSHDITTDFPGIVTRFLVQLLPAPKIFRSSGYIFPQSMYQEAFNWIIEITPTFDQDTEITAVCRYLDGSDEICFAVYFVTMKGETEEARKALLPTHETRPRGAIQEWFCQEDSLQQEYANEVSAWPGDRRWFADNSFVKNDVDVAAILKEICMTLPDRHCIVLWYPLAPHSRRNLPDMAFSLQSDHYVATYTIYESEKDDEKYHSWIHATVEKLSSFRLGSFSGEADFKARKVKCWGDAQWKKITQIRQKWDPDGRICCPFKQKNSEG